MITSLPSVHFIALLNFTNFVSSAGYAAIFILCVLQSCCVPTSSEITMGFAGVLAAQGKLSLPGVIVAGVAGEVVGAYIAWAVGRVAGRRAVDRFGRYVLLSHRDLDRAQAWYERHERFGVFGSRLLPVIRNFVALPAGIAEVPPGRFGILTAGGSLLWDGAWAGLGYGLASHWHSIAKGFGDLGYVLAVVVVGVLAFGIFHRYRSYKEATAGVGGSAGGDYGAGAGGTGGAGGARGGGSWLGNGASSGRHVREPALTPGALRWVASASGQPRHRRRDFADSPVAAWEAAVVHGRTHAAVQASLQPERERREPTAVPIRLEDTRRSDHTIAMGATPRSHDQRGQVPLFGRVFPAPIAAKVPETVLLFWVVKILSTAGGEAASDYFKTYGNLKGGAIEVGLFLAGLVLQFSTRRYRTFAYWFLAFAIAIFGTGVSDFLHLDVGIPYAGTTVLWALVLATIFLVWHRSEGTLSIHSITTQRREAFYWATVFATFALGTALGDFTAASLHLGYLSSGILFGILILLPALAWWKFALQGVAAFWMSYVLTRPLGASFADYLSKPRSISGIDFGNGQTAIVFAAAVVVLVSYLAITRSDVQARGGTVATDLPASSARRRLLPPELDLK